MVHDQSCPQPGGVLDIVWAQNPLFSLAASYPELKFGSVLILTVHVDPLVHDPRLPRGFCPIISHKIRALYITWLHLQGLSAVTEFEVRSLFIDYVTRP